MLQISLACRHFRGKEVSDFLGDIGRKVHINRLSLRLEKIQGQRVTPFRAG
jgi:hypothetical protein